MIAEKEKKTARANTPRRPVRCPQKTGINLNLHEKRTGTVLTLLIGALCITVRSIRSSISVRSTAKLRSESSPSSIHSIE